MTVPRESLGDAVSAPVSAASLGALRERIATAVSDGATSVVIDIDGIDVLDASVIKALISMLRHARERGATVRLRATRRSLLDTLRITALDKVFVIVSDDASLGPARPVVAVPKRPRRRRAAAAVLGIALALGNVLGARPVAATDLPAPLDIVRSVAEQNADMHTYRAAVSIDLALRSFPYVAQHLHGVSYFERPDNYELVLDNVPSFAKGFDKLYTDIGEPSSWPRRFTMTVVGEEAVGKHRDLVLRLVQKVRGMIDHEDVRVDPATWHIDEMEWHYYNGGVIAMSQEYESVNGFSVLAKQHATIRIPFVHAAADAVYANYETNVAIDDSVFTKLAKH